MQCGPCPLGPHGLESADFSSETLTTTSAAKHQIYCRAVVQSLLMTLPMADSTATLHFISETWKVKREESRLWFKWLLTLAVRNSHTQDPPEG